MTDWAFKVNIEWGVVFDAFLEFVFDKGALAEVDKIVYVQTEVEGWFAFDERTGEDARGVGEGVEAERF